MPLSTIEGLTEISFVGETFSVEEDTSQLTFPKEDEDPDYDAVNQALQISRKENIEVEVFTTALRICRINHSKNITEVLTEAIKVWQGRRRIK